MASFAAALRRGAVTRSPALLRSRILVASTSASSSAAAASPVPLAPPAARAFATSPVFKSHTKVLVIETKKRFEIHNITDLVAKEVEASGVKEGLVLVNPMHTSCGVFVDDADAGLYEDLESWLTKLAPWDPVDQYKHNTLTPGEVNGGAHLQRAVMGREAVVAITEGKLHLGTWERILYGEFDGKRAKKVLVKVIGG